MKKKIQVLELTYEPKTGPGEIAGFRSAIAKRFGNDPVFHQHHLNGKHLQQYPVVQYKNLKGAPTLLAFGDAAWKASALIQSGPVQYDFHGAERTLFLKSFSAFVINLGIYPTFFNYKIERWIALKGPNAKRFRDLQAFPEDQLKLLEVILRGNMLTLSKGIGLYLEDEIKVEITSPIEVTELSYKDMAFLAFSCAFSSNFLLPKHVGLGNGVSHGFGTVLQTSPQFKKHSMADLDDLSDKEDY
jgi:hypothetical protein